MAVHEAGHALVRHVAGASKPVLVTIVPSPRALGRTFFEENKKRVLFREDMLAMAASALGGRAAEEAAFGAPSDGAIGDLVMAEQILFAALQAGLSETNSDQALDEFIRSGASHGHAHRMSDLARKEVAEMLAESWEIAKAAIQNHRAALDAITDALVQDRMVHGTKLSTLLPKIEQ